MTSDPVTFVIAKHLRSFVGEPIDIYDRDKEPRQSAPAVDPFAKGDERILFHSLEMNPYEFFSRTWLTQAISGYTIDNTDKKRKKKHKEINLLNLRLFTSHDDDFILLPFIDALKNASDDTLVHVTSIYFVPSREAIVARQMRTREMRLCGSALYAVDHTIEKTEKTYPNLPPLDPEQCADRAILEIPYGTKFAARTYLSMMHSQKTSLALLVAEQRAALEYAKENSGVVAVTEKRGVEEESGEEQSEDMDGEEEEESGESEGDNEEDIEETEESVEKPKKEKEPIVRDLKIEPRLIDELQWMRVVVQKKSFKFSVQQTYSGPVGLFKQKCSDPFVLDELPKSIRVNVKTNTFIYCSQSELLDMRVQEPEPTIGDLCGNFGRVEETSDEQDWQFVAPAEPTPPSIQPSTRQIVVISLGNQALLDQIGLVDLKNVTLAELSEYGKARWGALYDTWCNMRAVADGNNGAKVQVYYPKLPRAKREWLRQIDSGVESRESLVEVIGLMVLAMCARFDERLIQNLLFLESLYLNTNHSSVHVGSEGITRHCQSIKRFWQETPDPFLQECVDDDSWGCFVDTLTGIATMWQSKLL